MSARHHQERALFAPGAYPSFYSDPDADRRACLGTPLEVWFGTGERGPAPAKEAKALCRRCPLVIRCRNWALSRPASELHGIWGGMTQYEREQHKVRASPEECPRCARRVGRVSGQPARHKTLDFGKWVWCE